MTDTATARPLPRTWFRLTYVYAALAVASLGYALIDLPIQVTDSYGNIVKAAQGTLGSLLAGEFHQRSYLRPFLWGQLRVVLDMSGGRYTEWFRWWHVGQLALLAVLFLRILRPRRWSDAVAVPLGVAVLVAHHTFDGVIREAFPINTFMTVLLCCFAAADLALGPPRWWRDVLAAIVFVFAALTVESGLVVAVVVVAARLAGARGVSLAGAAAQVALVAGYFVLRFAILQVGAPSLEERTSGFLFGNLDPDELAARFGDDPLPFYAYNVVASLLSVVVAEPRGGVLLTTRAVLAGSWSGPGTLNVLASVLASAFVFRYAWSRRHAWLARQTDRADQIVWIFLAVTAANAAISYGYTKDVILSPAGAFFALAVVVGVSQALVAAAEGSPRRVYATAALLLVLSSAWAVRLTGAHLGLRGAAAAMRMEWAYVDLWLRDKGEIPTDPFAIRVKQQLQDDAVFRRPLRPALSGDWLEWFVNE